MVDEVLYSRHTFTEATAINHRTLIFDISELCIVFRCRRRQFHFVSARLFCHWTLPLRSGPRTSRAPWNSASVGIG